MTHPTSTRSESSAERFFFHQSLQLANVTPGDELELTDQEAHHLLHVLRASTGQRIGLFNGLGDEATAEVIAIKKRSAMLRVLEHWQIPRPSTSLTMATAIPKGDRARWLIEKVTELGVTRLVPLRTTRSVVDPGDSKLDKFQHAIIAACKQSGRSHLMQLNPLLTLPTLLGQPDIAETTVLLTDPHAELTAISELIRAKQNSRNVLVLVGPEGGFTNEERTLAINSGAQPIRLGDQILRIETAVLAIASIWQSL